MTQPSKLQRLDTWKMVAAWLGWSIRYCRKVEAECRTLNPDLRMPVARIPGQPGGKGQRVYANASELDAWQERWLAASKNSTD